MRKLYLIEGPGGIKYAGEVEEQELTSDGDRMVKVNCPVRVVIEYKPPPEGQEHLGPIASFNIMPASTIILSDELFLPRSSHYFTPIPDRRVNHEFVKNYAEGQRVLRETLSGLHLPGNAGKGLK